MTADVIETQALVSPAAGEEVEVMPIQVDPPGPGEVRVRITASGICHTDRMVADGVWWADHPYVLGHEGVGLVEDVGPGVAERLRGRTVLLAWRAPCRACRFCKRGDEGLCVDLSWAAGRLHTTGGRVATPSLRLGTHSNYAVVAAGQTIPVPDGLPPAALCTIGCAVMTGIGAVRNTARVRPGERVAVLGCGGVGLSIIQGARLAGAAQIIAVDTQPDKLEAASALGATQTILVADGADAAEQVRAESGGFGVDHAFEAVGSQAAVAAAIRSCDVGGTATLVGTPGQKARLDIGLDEIFFNRTSLRTSQYGDAIPERDFPWIVDRYVAGELQLDELVTREITLDEAPAALLELGSGGNLRSVIRFDPK